MTSAKIAINSHRQRVREFLSEAIGELWKRYLDHDRSKLEAPEFPIFERHHARLAACEYGTPAYKEQLNFVREAILHHYALNRHHPEHFPDKGVEGMNLIDVLEMLCDWMAATAYGRNGDINKSIQFNRERFGLTDQMVCVLENTACWLKECAASAKRRYTPDDQGGEHAEAAEKAS